MQQTDQISELHVDKVALCEECKCRKERIVLMAAVCLRLLQKRKNHYRMRKKEGPGSQGSKIVKKMGERGGRQKQILCGVE